MNANSPHRLRIDGIEYPLPDAEAAVHMYNEVLEAKSGTNKVISIGTDEIAVVIFVTEHTSAALMTTPEVMATLQIPGWKKSSDAS